MFWTTHLFFGLGIASFFTKDPVVLAMAAFLAVVPDMDKPIGHRKWFSHSPIAALILSAAGFMASSFNLLYAFIVFIALFSHLMLDFLTKSGVPLLHPWKTSTYGLRLFGAQNKGFNRVFAIFGTVILLVNLWRYYPVF